MGKFQQKYEATESNQPQTPEQYLWTSVLSKAAHDAIYTSDWRESKSAIAWFKSNSKDFKEVCEMAGYDPTYVWEHIKSSINQREAHMEWVRTGNRFYVKPNPEAPQRGGRIYHSSYRRGLRRGPYKKKMKGKVGRPRKKDPYYTRIGKLGGRPRLYNHV
tara:strand:+ start:101 stop:580 length:480 start_codon:yes stop_codon:yes gene_type:complete